MVPPLSVRAIVRLGTKAVKTAYRHGLGKRVLLRPGMGSLKPFGIRPKTTRFGAVTLKGYEWAAFEDTWRRYVPEALRP